MPTCYLFYQSMQSRHWLGPSKHRTHQNRNLELAGLWATSNSNWSWWWRWWSHWCCHSLRHRRGRRTLCHLHLALLSYPPAQQPAVTHCESQLLQICIIKQHKWLLVNVLICKNKHPVGLGINKTLQHFTDTITSITLVTGLAQVQRSWSKEPSVSTQHSQW